jgi:twitching motility protein PilT
MGGLSSLFLAPQVFLSQDRYRFMVHIDALLQRAAEYGASDLHLRAGSSPLMRVQGHLQPLPGADGQTNYTEALLNLLTETQLNVFEQYHDLDFAYAVPSIGRFRVNYLRHHHGIGAVFRMVPKHIPTLDELGLPRVVREFAQLEQGLVLVTGPTGCGKSTTLAAMINHINQHYDKHIITIEDPLEFIHPNNRCLVTQREVSIHTVSFAAALRAALREDPDIILIGELRDLETISLAITAAETGHLVFGTLHTRTAASTVDRLIDVFPPDQQGQIRAMLAEALRGVVAQQLLSPMDGQERVVAAEILVGTTAVANLIREGKTYQIPSIIQTGRREHMRTMDQAILELLRARRITPQEAYRRAIDRETYRQYLERL